MTELVISENRNLQKFSQIFRCFLMKIHENIFTVAISAIECKNFVIKRMCHTCFHLELLISSIKFVTTSENRNLSIADILGAFQYAITFTNTFRSIGVADWTNLKNSTATVSYRFPESQIILLGSICHPKVFSYLRLEKQFNPCNALGDPNQRCNDLFRVHNRLCRFPIDLLLNTTSFQQVVQKFFIHKKQLTARSYNNLCILHTFIYNNNFGYFNISSALSTILDEFTIYCSTNSCLDHCKLASPIVNACTYIAQMLSAHEYF